MITEFSMNFLVCDTTQQACSVAIASKKHAAPIHLYEEIGTGHAEHLPRMLQMALDQARLSVQDLDGVGVTTGPGTFAGVRVGLAAMRGFAVAKKMPIYTMTGLELMAQTHLARSPAEGDLPLACVVDARRGQVYLQQFSANGTPLTPPEVLPIDAAATSLSGQTHVLIGTGGGLIAEHLAVAGRLQAYPQSPIIYPDAAYMLAFIQRGDAPISDRPAPLYLRPPDAALPKQDQRLKRQ